MGVLKQFQKDIFRILRSLARIPWDTGIPLGGKGRFFTFHCEFNWNSKSNEALIDCRDDFYYFQKKITSFQQLLDVQLTKYWI